MQTILKLSECDKVWVSEKNREPNASRLNAPGVPWIKKTTNHTNEDYIQKRGRKVQAFRWGEGNELEGGSLDTNAYLDRWL